MDSIAATFLGAAVGSAWGFVTSLLLWRRDQRRQWYLQLANALALGREVLGYVNSEALWLMTRSGDIPESPLRDMVTVHARALQSLRGAAALAPEDLLERQIRTLVESLSQGVHAFTVAASVRQIKGRDADLVTIEQCHDARVRAKSDAEAVVSELELAVRREVLGRWRGRLLHRGR